VPSFTWQDGERLLYLGNPVQLCLTLDACSRKPELEAGRLLIALPSPENAAVVSRKVLQWYRREALEDFTRRTQLLTNRLGVEMPPIALSSARTRWGSCNSRGEIRLNWRLIQAPPHIIHYVVAHELAHLKEMNHSPKFWAIVGKLCPGYIATRKELKTMSSQLHRMG
jgi:hypothetical protein